MSEKTDGRLENGRFGPGNHAAARTNGEKRRSLHRMVLEVIDEGGLAQAIRNLMGIASDPRRPGMAIRATDLLTKLVGLQTTTIELLESGEQNPADLRTVILERLAEIEISAPSQTMSADGGE